MSSLKLEVFMKICDVLFQHHRRMNHSDELFYLKKHDDTIPHSWQDRNSPFPASFLWTGLWDWSKIRLRSRRKDRLHFKKKSFISLFKRKNRLKGCVFALILLLGWSFPLFSAEKLRILTTVFPLKEFAQAVSGKNGTVSLLLPPGAEIHTWKPRPSDIIAISRANLFVYIGSDLEPWVHDILKSVNNSRLVVLEASKSINMRMKEEPHIGKEISDNKHGFDDPHIWLDFHYDEIIVDRIAEKLAHLDPKNKSTYKNNASNYRKRLQELDRKYETALKNCKQKTIILGGHAAFGYLARRYHLGQVSLFGVSPDAMPSPRKMSQIVEKAKKHHAKAVFFEVFVSNELARVLAREIDAKILLLNPGANLTRAQLKAGTTFIQLMEANLENLIHGLSCR